MNPFLQTLINGFVEQILVPLLVALVLAALAYLMTSAKKYLDGKIGVQNEQLVFEIVRRLVLAAEQYMKTSDGQAKMKWVLDTATVLLKQRGYKNIDLNLLHLWAEAALKQDVNNYPDLKAFTATDIHLGPATPPLAPPPAQLPTPAPTTGTAPA